jgi:uncharacterized protein (TIGR03000 family)
MPMYSIVLAMALSGGVEAPDFGRRRGGCYGGCYGGYVSSCYGGYGYGCYGSYGYGCRGGYGYGCYGGYGYGGYGYGGYGSMPMMAYGAPVGYGGYGGAMMAYGTPAGVTTTSAYNGAGTARPDEGAQPEANGQAPATLVVHLPAAATLTVAGTPTRSTSDTRRFVSPPLEPGKTYTYLLEAKLERGGETLRASQNVVVRAGRTAEVYLEFPRAAR